MSERKRIYLTLVTRAAAMSNSLVQILKKKERELEEKRKRFQTFSHSHILAIYMSFSHCRERYIGCLK